MENEYEKKFRNRALLAMTPVVCVCIYVLTVTSNVGIG